MDACCRDLRHNVLCKSTRLRVLVLTCLVACRCVELNTGPPGAVLSSNSLNSGLDCSLRKCVNNQTINMINAHKL